ncbi:hypothetical protein V8J36_22750, partial [Frigidibacter sp. MR17.14]|uniref:hypothetical protein n=1 Tax=Frigidibacter sp. MR17.14 TaxID=3126509 RepID=UPI0030129EA2
SPAGLCLFDGKACRSGELDVEREAATAVGCEHDLADDPFLQLICFDPGSACPRREQLAQATDLLAVGRGQFGRGGEGVVALIGRRPIFPFPALSSAHGSDLGGAEGVVSVHE